MSDAVRPLGLPVDSPSEEAVAAWKICAPRGTWGAQSVELERPTSAQVMISRFVGSSPASGSVLMAQSPEPASDSVSRSLSAPPPLVLCLSLSLCLKNKTGEQNQCI